MVVQALTGPLPSLRAVVAFLALALALPAAASARDESEAERDAWQRPAEVMDEIGLDAGHAVADVGCGDGYFSFHLARRVGADGRVYAVDVSATSVDRVREAARERGLAQIEARQGAADDPRLPESALDAILVVNAYHEMDAHDSMMRAFARALKAGGRLAIIDRAAEPGEPRAAYRGKHALPSTLTRSDAERAGLRFVREAPGFHRPQRGGEDWYFVVFEKAAASRVLKMCPWRGAPPKLRLQVAER